MQNLHLKEGGYGEIHFPQKQRGGTGANSKTEGEKSLKSQGEKKSKKKEGARSLGYTYRVTKENLRV